MQKEPKPSRNDNILHYHENFIYQEQNIDFVYNEQLYYQKNFPIRNQTERSMFIQREKLSSKNLPYFKICQYFQNKIKVQMKKYQSKAIQRLQILSLALKISIIRELLIAFMELFIRYGPFKLYNEALKIDEAGKFIIWICEDYQKLQFSIDPKKKGGPPHKLLRTQSLSCCRQFLKVFGHLLPHKKIRQNASLTCQQLQQILNQIKRKNQIHIKCHDIIKNRDKGQCLKIVTSLNQYKDKIVKTPQSIQEQPEKRLLKKSLHILSNPIQLQPKLKKHSSSNFGAKIIEQAKRLSFPFKNTNAFCSPSYGQLICQPRWSHFQKRFNSPRHLQTGIYKQKSLKVDKQNQRIPKFILNKNNPQKGSEKKQNKKIVSKIQQDLRQKSVHQFEIIGFYKRKADNLNNEKISQKKFNIRSEPIQIRLNPNPVYKLDVKFTSSINSEFEIPPQQISQNLTEQTYKQNNKQTLANVRSCQNLLDNCNQVFQNSTSTAPSLKSCQSHQHFFLSKLNPFEELRIQQQLNQMFSSRNRKQSFFVQDDQQYGELKQQLGDLLA